MDLDFRGAREEIFGAPVVGGIELLATMDAAQTIAVIAVGDGRQRRDLWRQV